MNRLSLMLLLAACGAELPGTQIGVEESTYCEVVSTTPLTDLDVVPPEFSRSLNAWMAGRTGTFTLDVFETTEDDEAATGEQLTLTVEEGITNARAVVSQMVERNDGTDLGAHCPPTYLFDIRASVSGAGVGWTGTVEMRAADEDLSGGEAGEVGMIDPMPAPTAFDVATMDRVEVGVRIAAALSADWWVTVFWSGERDDGLGEDGTASIHRDPVVMARPAASE